MNRANTIMRCLLLSLLVSSTVGCFREPLSDEKTSKVDERLLGKWNDGHQAITIRRKEGTNALEAVSVEGEGQDSEQTLEVLYTTQIGKQWFVSLRVDNPEDTSDKEDTPKYTVLAYRVGEDAVRFYELDNEHLKRGIKSGRLAGRVPRGEYGSSGGLFSLLNIEGVEVTDTPANLRKFLADDLKKSVSKDVVFALTRTPPKVRSPKLPFRFSLPPSG